MPIVERICNGSAGINEFDLELQISGMTLTLGTGTFKIGGVSFTIEEAISVTLDACAFRRDIEAQLLKEKATGELHFLLREQVQDGVHGPAEDDTRPYESLLIVYDADVPANTTDLATVPIYLNKMPVPPPEPPPGP